MPCGAGAILSQLVNQAQIENDLRSSLKRRSDGEPMNNSPPKHMRINQPKMSNQQSVAVSRYIFS